VIHYKTYTRKEKLHVIRLYNVWLQMQARCFGTGAHTRYYKDRGITLTFDWLDYFNFRLWALANGYRKGLTIDRIDNDGSYRPDNCRWVTRADQCKNQQHTIKYQVGDDILTQTELCTKFKVWHKTVSIMGAVKLMSHFGARRL